MQRNQYGDIRAPEREKLRRRKHSHTKGYYMTQSPRKPDNSRDTTRFWKKSKRAGGGRYNWGKPGIEILDLEPELFAEESFANRSVEDEVGREEGVEDGEVEWFGNEGWDEWEDEQEEAQVENVSE